MGTEEYLLDRFKKEGIQEGFEIGIQKGIKIGIKKSRKEGRRAVALEIAAEMKKDKFPIETISKLTKLSKKKIKAL